jgi:Tfp pilus assembly protein PilX
MKYFKALKDNRGIATFIALMTMVMLTMIGLAALKLANDEIDIAGNELNEMSAFYAAEGGLEQASAAMQTQYENTGVPPTTLPSGTVTINDCVVAYQTTDGGAATQEILTQGTLAGLHSLVKRFTITSTATSGIDNSSVTLTQNWECDLVPLFQFAVFYGNDLEIAPGPDMTLIGRVHSNGNLWLQAGSNLYMDSYVTCSGKLLHGRKGAGGVSNGSVYIKDADGNYQNMKNGDGSFLTAASTNWYDSAATRWGGRVQDSAFGQGTLNLPLTNAGDPHKIIERGASNPDSYENKADLRIIDGVVEAMIGSNWVDVSGMVDPNLVTTTTFYDARENKNVNTTEIDVSVLKDSPYYPSGGVIYFSDSRTSFDAARLVNGSELGQPMSFYSENPVYVQGDFNTVSKQPAAIAGDAVTFLSNSWNDSKSTWSKGYRVASQTTVNASIMTGNTNTSSYNYNGGLENLPRFLEVWSGKKFSYTGSLVNLWNSQQATGLWSGSYYDPPIRDWKYDTDLDNPNKLPPETPTVRVFQRTGWHQSDISYLEN